MPDKPAKLHLYIDVEAPKMSIKELTHGRVGHTWIALEWKDPTAVPDGIPHEANLKNGGKYADSMGFWPDTQGMVNGVQTHYSPNPFKSYVQGYMRNPDTAHEGKEKASQSWEITAEQARAVLTYAESKKTAQYSVYFYNCTTFGKEAVEAAGQSAPSMSKAKICYPNAAYAALKKLKEKGREGESEVMVKGEDTFADGWLGFSGQTVGMPDSFEAWSNGIDCAYQVTHVDPDGPVAGVLSVGDLLIRVEDEWIEDESDIQTQVIGKVDKDVKLTLVDIGDFDKFDDEEYDDANIAFPDKTAKVAAVPTKSERKKSDKRSGRGKKAG